MKVENGRSCGRVGSSSANRIHSTLIAVEDLLALLDRAQKRGDWVAASDTITTIYAAFDAAARADMVGIV
jgi:hypothetical protein